MRTRRWVKAVAGFRIVVGGGLVVAPGAWGRPWTGPAIDMPEAKMLARMFGVREVALGLGALAGLDDARQAVRWLQLGSVADAVDGAAVLVAWRRLPRVARYADLAMALGAALTNMLVARRILEHNDNPSPH